MPPHARVFEAQKDGPWEYFNEDGDLTKTETCLLYTSDAADE